MKNSVFFQMLGKIAQPFYGGIGQILMFHRVCDSNTIEQIPGQPSIEVSVEHFSRIVDFFSKRKYAFLSLDDLAKGLQRGIIKKPFVVFTFDDGYIDNLDIVFPILKDRNIPFAIYVTPSFIDRKAILWRYVLQDAVHNREVLNFSLSGIHYAMDLTNSDELPRSIKSIRSLIKSSEPEYFNKRLEQIFGKSLDQMQETTDKLMLSWDQILQLSSDPLVTIAAHTLNHYPLTQLTDAQVDLEIRGSRMVLESKIKRKINHFAYPYGAFGKRELIMVKSAEFITAVTTHHANVFLGHAQQMFALPRWDMANIRTMDDVELSLNGLLPARMNRFRRIVTL
jgi:peptidoglycan/xylan/chitin deacetylase (PgdA/CDA1 family)